MADSVRDLVAAWNWDEILTTLLVIATALVASRVFVHFVDAVASRWARRTASPQDDYILAVMRKPVSFLIVLIGIYVAVHRYSFPFRWFFDASIFVVGVGVVVYTVSRMVSVLLAWYGARLARDHPADHVERDLIPLAQGIARLILLLIGTVIVLDHFHIEIRSILVTLGVGSLAIGFALQDTLANMFGGFTLMLDRPFVVGDRIELAGGGVGDVQAIGIRSTRVLTPEGNVLVIPNAHLVKTMVTNHSSPDARIRLTLDVGVAYDADVPRAKALMLESAAADALVLSHPAPAAQIVSFDDSSIRLRLVCFIRDFRDAGPALDTLNAAIFAKFTAAGIEIPYPVRNVVLHRGDAEVAESTEKAEKKIT